MSRESELTIGFGLVIAMGDLVPYKHVYQSNPVWKAMDSMIFKIS